MNKLLEQARAWAQSGDTRAEHAYRQVLEHAESVEARLALANIALARGIASDAVAHLQQACRTQPGNAHLLGQLAVAAEAAGYPDDARRAYEFAVQLTPGFYQAHLHLGRLQEQAGDRHAALRSYFRALTQAQLEEKWLDEASTPPRWRALVAHAAAYVRAGRAEILAGLLDPLVERYGRAALRRVERALNGYLGVETVVPPDARQKPKFLYFPELPSAPYFRRDAFPWFAQLEAAYAGIRDEAAAVLAEPQTLTPFLDVPAETDLGEYLRSARETKPHWDAFFFFRHGQPYADNRQRCPLTARTLDALPLVRIAGHAPEICYSVLTAGTHILPHHGVSNVRAVVHLPLIVPRDCALTAGGEAHAWREGECVAFDDTWLHEAWNRSDDTRVILLMDAWNPHLTEPEREAMTLLIEGIGDLNRG